MNLELTYKQVHKLLDKGVKMKVNTPYGKIDILQKFLKKSKGYILKYDDGTETKCSDSHYIEMTDDLKPSNEINIGEQTSTGKVVVDKIAVPEQQWYDFEINHSSGLYYQNGIVHHNSGKSYTISLIAEFFRRKGKRGILLVPNINLLTQFKSDINDYNLTDLYNDCGLIGGGNSSNGLDRSLTITTWQSMAQIEDLGQKLEDIDYVICDEAHRFASEVTSEIVKSSTKARYKFGFTGTLPEDPVAKMELIGLFGLPKTYITSAELIDRGLACPIKINTLILNHNVSDKKIFREIGNKYPKQLTFVKDHVKRNELVVNLTCKLKSKGNSLILFQHTTHGKGLFIDIMKQIHPGVDVQNKDITGKKSFEFQEKYGIYFLNGEDNAATREKTRKILEEQLFKITLEDGTIIRVHGNNEIKLINGSKKLVKDLTENDEIDNDFLKTFRSL